MEVSLFDYALPEDLIARFPARERTHSRLLVLDPSTGAIKHDRFFHIGSYLQSGDLLVMNDTKVIPARLMGQRIPGGGKAEVLLIREMEPLLWRVMVRPGKKIQTGNRIVFQPKILEAEVVQYSCRGERLIRFTCQGDWWALLEKIGHTPLPPYILKARRDHLHTDFSHTPLEEEEDRERYQTVFARDKGSVAAPTAGLHFSAELLSDLRSRGIDTAFITLHIGPGTFKPVTVENVEDHPMHSEIYSISGETADRINKAHEDNRRIIAVGTTTVRTLETAADEEGRITPCSGETSLLIAPGYRFKCINALVTNFHLPRSTLLMLVCAFGGFPNIMKAYEEAVREKYRFYSYGDAMLIINQGI